MNDASVAYALTRVPLPVGLLGAAILAGAIAWVSSRRPSPPPTRSLQRRASAMGFPLFLLAAVLVIALARSWSFFDQLEDATDREASALVSLARYAQVLPHAERLEVRALARRYAVGVADGEFASMDRGERPPSASPELDAMSVIWSRADVAPWLVRAAQSDLARIDELRRKRHAAISPAVPLVFLALGLVALIASLLMASEVLVGPPRIRFAVTALLVFVFLTAGLLVAQFSLPFAGDVSVDSDAFVDAANELR